MSILDIARSGILSYRSALSVTAENIANVNTDGYVRREVVLAQSPGGQTTPTSAATSGQGVRVEDVRRAFDGLLAQRLRTAEGAAASATSLDSTAAAIETLFLSGAGSVPDALKGFFDAVNGLATNPADGALRQVFLAAGEGLATSFRQVAGGLAGLRAEVVDLSVLAADLASSQLSQLAELNARMVGSSQGALNPLLDERDRLLRDLSRTLGVTATFDSMGRARVTLGATPGGPVLLEGDVATRVQVVEDRTGMQLSLTRNGTTTLSRQFTGGSLQGFAAALGAVDASALELDTLAGRIRDEMNAIHRQGLDLSGVPGGDLFSTQRWNVVAAPGNGGTGTAGVISFDPRLAPATLTLVRETDPEGKPLWIARNEQGQEIGRGASEIRLDGLILAFDGVPRTGDQLTLTLGNGSALDMRFVPTNIRQIAAAAATLVSADPANRGSATAAITPVAVEPPRVGTLASLLQEQAPGEPLPQYNAPLVAYIPAGTKSLSLSSLGTQAQLEFQLTDAQAQAATRLSFTLDGALHEIDLPAADSLTNLAARLNENPALAGLGIVAGAANGRLTLTLGAGNFGTPAATITGPGLTSAATAYAAAPAGGNIQIITRDGRHIAGTPLSPAEVATLLTEANGFLPGAVYTYTADYLNAADGTGYRGVGFDSTILPGQQVLSLTIAPPTVGTSGALGPAATSSPLRFDAGKGLPTEVALPGGASARRAAELINAALDGIEAEARTAVEISAADDGLVSFRLQGGNLVPLSVSGAVAGGRMDGLAQAVNALTDATGIRAELSPDGSRLLLVHDGGEDIILTDVRHGGGGPVILQPAGADAAPVGAPVTLSGTTDSLRVTGQVRLASLAAFSAEISGQRQDSQANPLLGGLIDYSTSAAGGVARLDFRFAPGIDGASLTADGQSWLAPSARYSVTVGGLSASLAPTGPESIAAGLAAALRADAPQASLVGRDLTVLPADGRSVALSYDGQSFTLRMREGRLEITGGEPGLLQAAFEGNRLVVRAAGSLDGSGITVESGAAAAFGLGTTDAPLSRLTGGAPDPAGLPASFEVQVGTSRYMLTASAGDVTVPAGFPGTARWEDGRLLLEVPAHAGALRIPPQEGARAAGLRTEGVQVAVRDGGLVLTSTTGRPVPVTAGASALASQRVSLTGLPDEDMMLVMTGAGALRLAGSVETGARSATASAVEVRVLDAATRRIELFDQATGHSIGTRTLGADGSTTVGGLRVTLAGTPATGDRFLLTPNTATAGGAETLARLLDLAMGDRVTGQGGFGSDYAQLQSRIGAQARAAAGRVSSTTAGLEVAQRAQAKAAAVDLDAEAARLIEQQQAYQASSQVLSVAQTLFETLLNAL